MSSSVGYSASSATLTPAEIAGAGATSGFITRMLTQPLDVLKIRFQLQVESTRRGAGGQYHGLLQGSLKVVREEGVKALWRGHGAAQALTVLYGAGQFWCYNFATRTCHEKNKLLAQQHTDEEKCHCNNNNCSSRSTWSGINPSKSAANAQDNHINGFFNHHILSGTNPVTSNNTSHKPLVTDTIDNRRSCEEAQIFDNRTSETIARKSIGSSCATSSTSSTDGSEVSDSAAVTVFQMSLCGGVAGLCGTLVSMPCDVARTRIVAQSTKKYRGLLDVWGQMRCQEGLSSLWRGLLPTIASSAPFAAIQFPVYSFIMTVTEGWATKGDGLMWRSPVAGCAAGLVAKLAVYPLDLLKKRSQMRGAEHLREHFGKIVTYGSSLDIVRRVTLEEGALAWFKGLSPALVKSALVSALAFSTFEAVCLLLRAVHGADGGWKRAMTGHGDGLGIKMDDDEVP